MIVVTAAGGRTGLAVVAALRARGQAVRALVSSPRASASLTALGAEVVQTDLTDVDSLPARLAGAQAVHLIWPNFDAREQAGSVAVLAAARRAGVGRLVHHSVLHPQVRAMPHHAAKERVEEAVVGGGVPWRVLRPCAYADNLDAGLSDVAATGRFSSPWGLTRGQSLVDLRDVAEVAAVLLTEDGLDGGTFEVAGPEPLTAPAIAGLLAQRLDREVTAVDVVPDRPVPPVSDYAAHCRRLMFDWYREHGFTGTPWALEALLGRPARTLADHLAAQEVTR
ncbi:NmrA family NAD(P)-binding protein [Modestobacter muralis]|uniref:NmrA family NAD(P)-binding protein n=1 Tax=Modestobacter muralis TaxID=1608614 RepID=A0A6P0H1U5_9ACTN|nr:NmrA family NAD(P)-binding protein [Modestobacter muralis]NEK92901.1 NmrA family NAD(P)-binding protein [Modestobacter muralis]NEN49668.1 NmrA family NAD(P)-binding protein [Modestobacter muralis]